MYTLELLLRPKDNFIKVFLQILLIIKILIKKKFKKFSEVHSIK